MARNDNVKIYPKRKRNLPSLEVEDKGDIVDDAVPRPK